MKDKKLWELCELKAQINNGLDRMPKRSFSQIWKGEMDGDDLSKLYLDKINRMVDSMINDESHEDIELSLVPYKIDPKELYEQLGGRL